VPIHFGEAIPIAVVGLLVNVASAWLLSGDDHPHGHSHGHAHGHGHDENSEHAHGEESREIATPTGSWVLSIFEEGVPPVFRIEPANGQPMPPAGSVSVTTIRPDALRQVFRFSAQAGFMQSTDPIPEPHAFKARVTLPGGEHDVEFEEHPHQGQDSIDTRDHNMRAAYVHVIADAAVSVLAIVGLTLAKIFGWLWMDPLAGTVGALVIANWSFGLIRDTGAILLDICPSDTIEKKIRSAIDTAGDQLLDLHVWRLGPGHFAAVVSVISRVGQRGPAFYHHALRGFKGLSHLTVEVHSEPMAA